MSESVQGNEGMRRTAAGCKLLSVRRREGFGTRGRALFVAVVELDLLPRVLPDAIGPDAARPLVSTKPCVHRLTRCSTISGRAGSCH